MESAVDASSGSERAAAGKPRTQRAVPPAPAENSTVLPPAPLEKSASPIAASVASASVASAAWPVPFSRCSVLRRGQS
eukprot:1673619-Pleurochrysis_carterae.AAC.1